MTHNEKPDLSDDWQGDHESSDSAKLPKLSMNADAPEVARHKLIRLLQSDSFSGVAVVRHEGQALIEFAGGVADRKTGRLVQMETRFAAASVSKMFTATCLARLVDAGLCRFEQPLIEVAPSLATWFDREMTLASLLSHHSGLGDYLDDGAELPFAGMDVMQLDCPRAFLPYILQAPRSIAGEFSYSSVGFILLGIAVEELTGKPFSGAMAQWVFDAAGMSSTSFAMVDGHGVDISVGYLPDGRPNKGHLPCVGGPDGGDRDHICRSDAFFRLFEDTELS